MRIRSLALVAAALAGIVYASAAYAQESAKEPQEQQPAESAVDQGADILHLPASSWSVGPRPDPVEKVYPKSEKKVWKALLKALDKLDIPIDYASEEAGIVNTKLTDFTQESGWGNVATKPPDMTKERPIMQKEGLRRGKYSLSITLAKEDGGTRVVLSAYLEEEARYVTLAARIQVERYSNGHIENLVLEELDRRL